MSEKTTRPEADGGCPRCGAPLDGAEACARCAFGDLLRGGEPAAGVLFVADGHEVLAELGRGATGIVYRVRQEHPARVVAMKVLRPHEATSADARARFRLEATTVAGLDHPAILPVLGVGEHDGLPYFTMKLCAGGSLAERIGRYRGRWREIASLVATLADAVHHAHVRGVLHRDLKPGNILFDEEERVFVSDFGIAKSSRDAAAGSGPATRPLAVMGTLGYVAPEVLRGGAGAATAAADVYALGVILRELLAGSVATEGAVEERGAPPPGAPRDLAVIAAMCERPEPAGRYASTAALAEDLRRWLGDRPILARRAGTAEKLVRWCRREPAVAAAAGLAAVLVLVLAVGGPVVALRLERERQKAETERARASAEAAASAAVVKFLKDDLLGQASPELQSDRNLTLRTVLDRAAAKIDGRFPAQPTVEAAVRETIGLTYAWLGEHATARKHAERTLALRRQALGERAPETLQAAAALVELSMLDGNFADAVARAEPVLAAQRATLGADHPDTLATASRLGNALHRNAKFADAERLIRDTLERQRRVLAADDDRTVGTLSNLGDLMASVGRLPEAEKLAREALAIQTRTLGPDNAQTLNRVQSLGFVLWNESKFAETQALLDANLPIARRVLGPDHPLTLSLTERMAWTHRYAKRTAEAEALQLEVLAAKQRVLGPEHSDTVVSMTALAGILGEAGKMAEAEALAVQVVDINRRVMGPEHPNTLISMGVLGNVYRQQKKFTESAAIYEPVVAAFKRTIGVKSTTALISQLNLVEAYIGLERCEEAEALLVAQAADYPAVFGAVHRTTVRATQLWVAALRDQGRFIEAADRQAHMIAEQTKAKGAEDKDALTSRATESLMRMMGGQFAAAEKMEREDLPVRQRVLGAEHVEVLYARNRLVQALQFQGGEKLKEAASLAEKLVADSRRLLGENNADTFTAETNLGYVYLLQGRMDDAADLLAGLWERRRAAEKSESAGTLLTVEGLAWARTRQGRFTEAEALAGQALAGRERTGGPAWRIASARVGLGRALAGQKRYAEAEPVLTEAFAKLSAETRKIPATAVVHARDAAEALAGLYSGWSKPGEAEIWRVRAAR